MEFLYQVRLLTKQDSFKINVEKVEESHLILGRTMGGHIRLKESRGAAQLIDSLPSMQEALVSISTTNKLGMVLCACNHSTQDTKARGLEVQCH